MESDTDDDMNFDEVILDNEDDMNFDEVILDNEDDNEDDSEDDSSDSPSQSGSDDSSQLPEPATTSQDSTNSPNPGTSSSCQDVTTSNYENDSNSPSQSCSDASSEPPEPATTSPDSTNSPNPGTSSSCQDVTTSNYENDSNSPSQSCSDASSELPEPATSSPDSTNSPNPGISSSCQVATTTHRKRALHISTRSDHGTLTSKANSRVQTLIARFESTSSVQAKTISPSNVTNALQELTTSDQREPFPHKNINISHQDATKSHQNVATSPKDVIMSRQDVTTSSQDVTTSSQDVTISSQDVTTSSQDVITSSQNVTTSSQDVTISSQDVTTSSQDVITSSQNVTTSSQNVTTSSQDVTTSSQDVTTSSQDVTTSHQDIKTSLQDVSISHQDVTTSPKDVTPSPKDVTTAHDYVPTSDHSVTILNKDVATSKQDDTYFDKAMTTSQSEMTTTSVQQAPGSSLVAVGSGPIFLRPVGGSVSTCTGHVSRHASGNEVLELVGALMEEAGKSDYGCAVERREERSNKEVHVHLTKTDIHQPQAVSIGGEIRVGPPQIQRRTQDPGQLSHLKRLRNNTEKTFNEWTEGMVMTEAARTIINKVNQGRAWVTVTGCPGEGKTTAGYLALKDLHKRGREVFDVRTPDDYFRAKEAGQSVIMLNDIFGALTFDSDSFKKWQGVLSDVLALAEHKQEIDMGKINRSQRQNKPELTVILISRSSILREASSSMGKFKHLVLKDDNTVDLTDMIDLNVKERMDVWKSHAEKYGINIDRKIVKEVCSMELSYGFPHCCRLFAAMYRKDNLLDMKHFFLKPLVFLNKSMESLIEDSLTGPLLREMLKNDGSLDLDDVEDHEKRYQYSSTAKLMIGTFIALNNRKIEFHHPSIYDSAAFLICQIDPRFVISFCSLSFLNDRVRLKDLTRCSASQSHQTISIDNTFKKFLLERFWKEFREFNISGVLLHASFVDEGFVSKFMQNPLTSNCQSPSSEDINDLLNIHDKESNKSFLFLMTKSGSDKILRYIHQYVELTEEQQSEALFGACEHSSVSALEYLLQRYKDINLEVRDGDNQTPLLVSTQQGSKDMIRILLTKNANVNAFDNQGNTPLLNVCNHGVDGDGFVVKMLIDKGVIVTIQSPLCFACEAGHTNVVKALLNQGVDINKAGDKGRTPLHFACQNGHVDVVTELLDKGADIDKTVNNGWTPLHLACQNGHVDVVTVLLDRGADIDKTLAIGPTPLHLACQIGHVDVVTVLLDKGADVNKLRGDGPTPLHLACDKGHLAVVTVLLDKGADINKTVDKGWTPLHLACQRGHVDDVTVLLDKGADVHKTKDDGWTPLHLACENGHVEVVTVLLDKGADVNKTEDNGWTSLHQACQNGHVDVVTILLDRGADVKKKTDKGSTPLHLACQNGHVDVVTVLLDRGADIDKTLAIGRTPLHLACQNGHVDVVTVLLDRGADVNIRDTSDETPLTVAIWKQRTDVQKLLLERQ